MNKLKTHGITKGTPKEILLGAGAYYKNLKYEELTGWTGTVLGATQGGGKLSITPEYLTIEVDGATVKVKGLEKKVGETANMEINLLEIKESHLVEVLHMEEDTTKTVPGYKIYRSKRDIGDDDYFDNIAFVGTLTSGEQVIIIFENGIIEGALELEPKNKEVSVFTATIECTASFEQDDLEHLPYYIYYPQEQTEEETLDNTVYTQEELEGKTVDDIKGIAEQRGYTITKTLKAEIITEFLEQQNTNESEVDG